MLTRTPSTLSLLTWDVPWAPRVQGQTGFQRIQGRGHQPAGPEATHRSGRTSASSPGQCTAADKTGPMS